MKITEKTRKIVADILTEFMFVNTMDDVFEVWDRIYKRYDLCKDPFTGIPCTIEEYCKSQLEYERQTMIEMYGHCDGLD